MTLIILSPSYRPWCQPYERRKLFSWISYEKRGKSFCFGCSWVFSEAALLASNPFVWFYFTQPSSHFSEWRDRNWCLFYVFRIFVFIPSLDLFFLVSLIFLLCHHIATPFYDEHFPCLTSQFPPTTPLISYCYSRFLPLLHVHLSFYMLKQWDLILLQSRTVTRRSWEKIWNYGLVLRFVVWIIPTELQAFLSQSCFWLLAWEEFNPLFFALLEIAIGKWLDILGKRCCRMKVL